jgi:hypothetical protein
LASVVAHADDATETEQVSGREKWECSARPGSKHRGIIYSDALIREVTVFVGMKHATRADLIQLECNGPVLLVEIDLSILTLQRWSVRSPDPLDTGQPKPRPGARDSAAASDEPVFVSGQWPRCLHPVSFGSIVLTDNAR